jgi:RHS repeat-associated protein
MNIIGQTSSDTLKKLKFSNMSLEQAYPETSPLASQEMPQYGGEDPGGYTPQGRILYWYHPDYIQNVDLITDIDGAAYELFLYNPWGEQLHHWTSSSSSWTSPYRFNAKELDPETGLAYYGARYYQNKIGVWLSVDPMAKEYQSVSSYCFTLSNPLNLKDPNGKWVEGGGLWNNILYSDNQVVKIMAQTHAKKTGGELMTIDGGYRVLGPSNKATSETNNNTINVELKDFYFDRLSGPSPRLGAIGIGLTAEVVYPGKAMPNGKATGGGFSVDIFADAENNLNLFKTIKNPDNNSRTNQFGLNLAIQFSFTIGTNGSPNPLNTDLLGRGIEAGVGAGPLGMSVTKPEGSNYLMFTIPFGNGIDFGLTNWMVETY